MLTVLHSKFDMLSETEHERERLLSVVYEGSFDKINVLVFIA